MPASSKTTARSKAKASTAKPRKAGKAKATSKAKAKQPRQNGSLTKEQVTKVATMRRQGATWRQVYAFLGRKSNSTQMRKVLEAAGYDRFGRKGGVGKSKARGHGAKGDPNITPVKRTITF
jgi:hypothetical protein